MSIFRSIYKVLDRVIWGRLPVTLQLRSKAAALAVAAWALRGKVPRISAESLVVDPVTASGHLKALPDWAAVDLAEVATDITPELNPVVYLASRPAQYRALVHRVAAGRAYAGLRARLDDDLDVLFIVPWLTRGGADLGVLHYVRACVEQFGHRVAVIATEVHPSPWASRLPPQVPFIAAGELLEGLDEVSGEPVSVLARLLVQARPRRIHIVNSRLGWETVKQHGSAIRSATQVYASLFCDERDADGFYSGYAVDFLRDVSPHLQAVITDNAMTPRMWCIRYGLDPELFSVVRFPAPMLSKQDGQVATDIPHRRLLWASRMDRQKRPDILLGIARALPEYTFDVYGSADGDGSSVWHSELQRQSNVVLRGSFDSLADVVTDAHLAFIYTSEWDGLPLVLLDAICAGLPVLAPAIGGIADLLPSVDMIGRSDSVEEYVALVRRLEVDPSERGRMIARQTEGLALHSEKQFVQSLTDTLGYGVLAP